MKVGLIMPICTSHEMQVDSWTSARGNSLPETPFVALFNGREPEAMPEGTTVVHHPPRFEDEADLWWWCLEYAQAHGWDWCMVIHDDFRITEPGWEKQLEESAGWRVALASWVAYDGWDEQANSSVGISHSFPHRHAVVVDSCSFGFRVDLFAERGCIAATRWGYGFGAWDANGWALSQGYAVWRILLNSHHNWKDGGKNTRAMMNIGAPGHPEIKTLWASVLPAAVADSAHMLVAGKLIRVAPDEGYDATGGQKEPIVNQLDYGSSIVSCPSGERKLVHP